MPKQLILATIITLTALTSCITEDVPSNTPVGNFEALWSILDNHYCFFDEKEKQYALNWDSVYAQYKQEINDELTDFELFEKLTSMICTLRDGHVNLYASHDVGRYWKWFEDYPANYSDSIERIYLGTDYEIASGIKYRVLKNNIGYMQVSTFENSIGSGNLSEIFRTFAMCDGLIIDVRNNMGGMITSAQKLASAFITEKTCMGYIRHKTGTGHNDFSGYKAVNISPLDGLKWRKPVVVLTNRSTYSAGNSFVTYMHAIPEVKFVGDKTGGGAGLPFNSELPNGWNVRFSACPMYDKDKVCTEDGIDPDIKVDITSDDYNKGIDTIIETAINLLKK